MEVGEPGEGVQDGRKRVSWLMAEREQSETYSPRFWRWAAVGLGLVAFAKGFRLPNVWAYTQAQLDYSVGFMRRGLFGAAVGRPLGLNHYEHFAALSTVLLLLLFAGLALLARRAKHVFPDELLAVFASSYSVTYLAHLNGYLDILLALLCLVPLFVRSTAWRLGAAVMCATIGMLIHEQFFFAFLPVLVVSVWFGAATGKLAGSRRLARAGGVLLVLLGVGAMVFFARHGSLNVAQTQRLFQTVELRADRPVDPEVLKVLPRTPQENWAIMRTVWARPTFFPAQVESLLLFGPAAVVLSWSTLVVLRRWRPDGYRWLYAGVLTATLAPLSLHLMGWDKSRWNELLVLNAFLMLLVTARLFGGEAVRLPVKLKRACVLVMLLNMATGGGMLDDRHIRPFPFISNPDGPKVGLSTTR